jgi:DNA-binding Lrp family transcriptional regulator
MSLRAMTWALHSAPVDDATQLLVLYALADRASDDGTAAWPGQTRIAEMARCSPRTVRRHLLELEEQGLIRRGDQRLVEHLRADQRPVVWDLDLTAGQNDRPVTGSTNDRSTVSYKPSITTYGSKTVQEPIVDPLGDAFAEAWKVWPKKAARKDARRRFTAAVKVRPVDELVEDVKRFAAAYIALGTEVKYVPALGVWLNGERWTDDLPGQERPTPAQEPVEQTPVSKAESKRRWCEAHGVTVTQWDSREALNDIVWMRDVVDGKMVDRTGGADHG